jgi:urease subunit gamma/beta
VHLSPRDIDKLLLHNAGFLAQKRLARGVRLNYPESVALIATQILEFIRDGRSVAELMNLGKQFLGHRQVMPGVPAMVVEVQVEGTFPDGTKLVTVHHPISAESGNLELALYGSFLPIPHAQMFIVDEQQSAPGLCEPSGGHIILNEGRETVTLQVTNLGDRPIQVGSHYHFVETNSSLKFDRDAAYGKRLDIPAGTATRFEPGDTKSVVLVDIAGNKIIRGGNNLADGPVSDANLKSTMEKVTAQNFANEGQA